MRNHQRKAGNDTCHHCFPMLEAQLRLGSTSGSYQRTTIILKEAHRSRRYLMIFLVVALKQQRVRQSHLSLL